MKFPSQKLLLSGCSPFLFFFSDTIIPTDVTHDVDESESPTQTEKIDSTIQDETDGTEVSKLADGFELTTSPPSKVTSKAADDDDDFEIVPDTNCDDGEWVDVEKQEATTSTSKWTEDDKEFSTNSWGEDEKDVSTLNLVETDKREIVRSLWIKTDNEEVSYIYCYQ